MLVRTCTLECNQVKRYGVSLRSGARLRKVLGLV